MCARCELRERGVTYCGAACARSAAPRRFRAALLAAPVAVAIAVVTWSARGHAPAPLRRAAAAQPRPFAQRPPALAPASLPPAPPVSAARTAVLPRHPPAGSRSDAPDLLRARPAAASDRPIVVSFDAGSSDRGATDILDALRQRSIRTSVFLTGEFIRRFPDIARRIAADGHEVGNHTFNHPHLTQVATGGGQRLRPGVTEEFLRDQLLRTRDLYERTTGRTMAPIWRAPFGEENPEIRAWAARAGYAHVSWTHGEGASLDALDWVSDESSPRYRSSRRVIDRLLAAARPGGIILMHLGSDRRSDPVGREVPRLLDGLAAEGYRFATATEFLGIESVPR
jgi:peptidoglycan/xylan/chitin deacetylase (PgdA/CDA1 family)